MRADNARRLRIAVVSSVVPAWPSLLGPVAGREVLVVGRAAHVEQLTALEPDLVVFWDDDRPDLLSAVADAARQLRLVLVLARPVDGEEVGRLLQTGVHAVLTTDAVEEELPVALQAVVGAGGYLGRTLFPHVQRALAGLVAPGQRDPGAVLDTLTPREREALALVASGYTHAQAARLMSVSTSTVNTYVKRLRVKLDVGNKADLTRRAVRLGVLD